MATRKEILQDIRSQYGNMVNITEAGKLLGYSDRTATKRFLEGLPIYDLGKEKKYMAIDIAKRIDSAKMAAVGA